MFNTFKYAHKLEEAGFSRLQAEASINILEEVMNENLATKQDVTNLNNKIESVKQEIKFEITYLTSRDFLYHLQC